jgi:hypothetical protein
MVRGEAALVVVHTLLPYNGITHLNEIAISTVLRPSQPLVRYRQSLRAGSSCPMTCREEAACPLQVPAHYIGHIPQLSVTCSSNLTTSITWSKHSLPLNAWKQSCACVHPTRGRLFRTLCETQKLAWPICYSHLLRGVNIEDCGTR